MEVLPDYIKKKWQEIIDLLAELIDIPSSLIMYTENKYMEVLISSRTKGNPYHVGDKEKWDGLYCETVIKSQMELLIPNALNDRNWDKNPDIKLGMISYLGFPINYPDKKPFGTICVLDNKENEFSETYIKLIKQFRDIIENDLANMFKHASIEKEIKKLSEAVKQSANSIVITDLKGNIEYSNPIFSKISGYTAEEVLGKNPNILNSGQQSKEFYSNMWEIISGGEIWSGEFKNKKKNGKFYWEEATISPIKNDTGEIINYLAIKKDISELKENEKILKEKNIELSQLSDKLSKKNRQLFDSQNKFKKLFDKSPVSIMEQDFSEAIKLLNKKKTETSDIEAYLNENLSFVKKCVSKIDVKNVNEITLSLLGVKNLEELKSHFIKSNTKKSYNSLKNELASIALGKKDFYGETEFTKSDGTILHAMIKSTMIDDKGKNIASIINITERKKAEEELLLLNKELEEIKNMALEGEKSYKALFKSIGDAIYIQDYDAKFIDVNSGVLNMYGYSKEELIGNTPIFLSAPDMNDMPAVFESFDKVKQGFSQVFEFWGIRKNGEIFPKTVGQFKGTYFGQDVIITVARDISNQIKTQQELILAKEKAEESDKLKSAFLANMSHEIRTPMNGILGFSELLKSPNLSGDQQQKFIGVIEKSGHRMLNIINDIVDISKIEAGLMKVDIQESNINEQIEYIYTFFKPEVEAKGMQLFFKNKLPAKEATIKTDREKVFAVLTNVVKNAIKYSKEGSIEFGYEKKGGYLEFFVKDTGVGIPKERQEAIFERFVQADILDTMARQGAGLGLSITKSYIEMLGGKIWVESEEGIGSTFYFTLPYNVELKEKISTKDIEASESSANHIKTLKILIAEDDETSEMLLSINVSEFTDEIMKARTGIEAIEACRNNPDIDLILMDIQMPEMNGHEATRQIRKFNKDVIIIAQTAYGLTGDREKSIEAGCNDYITKPINKPELDSLIQKYFKK